MFKKSRIAWNKGLPKEQQPHFGRKHTKDTKSKISEGNKGKIISIKQRKTLSKCMLGNKIWLGRKHTEETKKKISKAHIDKLRNNGILKNGAGYILIHSPNHPHKNDNSYFLEHRLVMEKYINRYLTKKEVVHHINEIRDDNRIENLMLFKNKGDHKKFHLKKTRDRIIYLNKENLELKKQIKYLKNKSSLKNSKEDLKTKL